MITSSDKINLFVLTLSLILLVFNRFTANSIHNIKVAAKSKSLSKLKEIITVQSLYNTPCYNAELDKTQSCCGPKFFTMEFYKGIKGLEFRELDVSPGKT